MVIGNGLIAKRFYQYADNDSYLIFASGVSNSKSAATEDFIREASLLKAVVENNPDKTLVYFSTCSIFDQSLKNSPYVTHKLAMERYILANARKFLIFRVSNIVGHSTNPHTVLNFLMNHIKQQQTFDLWLQATRNLIDIDDFFQIADSILQQRVFKNQCVNIANPYNYPVKQIVDEIERFCGKKAIYSPVNKGFSFDIDISQIRPVIEELGLTFTGGYLSQLLTKYYDQ